MVLSYSSLQRNQKEAIGLLQIGTFLEYFDLMLYVHMAAFLNELFFPKTDPHTAALLIAFAFCSTYVLRPFGALLFGYIGDHIGRKTTVIMTTMMMAISCITMVALPTYAQIGITAAWMVTICRMLQGLSSMGEIIGAEIYLTEITKPPVRYPIVGLVGLSAAVGSMAALGIATLVTTAGFNWRHAFLAGACIALIGSVARTRLRETPDFVDMKGKMKRAIEGANQGNMSVIGELLKNANQTWQEKVNKKTSLACFFIQSTWPICFYFCYVYCGSILKNTFGYTAEQVIHQNLIVSIVQCASFLLFILLSVKINPLKLLKFKMVLFFPFILIAPYLLSTAESPYGILLIQSFCIFFALVAGPAIAIMISYFPVYKRFTYNSFIYALSRALIYVITSFGLVYLTDLFGHWGWCFIMIPACIAFLWGVHHFERFEKGTENYDAENYSWSLLPTFMRKAA